VQDPLEHVADNLPFPVKRRGIVASVVILRREYDGRDWYFDVRYTMRSQLGRSDDAALASDSVRTCIWSETQFVPSSLLLWQRQLHAESGQAAVPKVGSSVFSPAATRLTRDPRAGTCAPCT
jgi:hypothetical protein